MKFLIAYVCKCIHRKEIDCVDKFCQSYVPGMESHAVLFCEYYLRVTYPFISEFDLDMLLVHDDDYIFVCVQCLRTVAIFFDPGDISKHDRTIEPIASGKCIENMQKVFFSVRRMKTDQYIR